MSVHGVYAGRVHPVHRFSPLAAGAAAGVAAWFTAGSLGRLATPDGIVRVGMLPSVAMLAAFSLAGVAAGAGLGALLRQLGPREAAARRVATLLPLFSLLVLALPFFPALPDRVPVLVALAGSARYGLWFVVAGLVTWAVADALDLREAPDAQSPPSRSHARRLFGPTLQILTASALAFTASGLHLTRSPVYPGGDEPHYLVMAQSLWRDGDLAIENNHQRGDYREYFGRELKPDYLARGVDGQIYSVHPVGLPLLVAPVYAAAGYRGVTVFLALVAAGAAAMAWRRARALATPAAATFGWLAAACSAPFLLNSFTVYPEIVAGLCVAAIVTTNVEVFGSRRFTWLLHGVAAAALPWLSTKYAPMSAVLVLVSLWRIWRTSGGTPVLREPSDSAEALDGSPRVHATALLLVPYALGLAAWFFFFHAYWGTFSPTAPYGTHHQTSVLHLRTGLPGLLFDQEYGVVPYAPIVLVGIAGLWHMWRAGGTARTTALELAVTLGALVGTVGAFRIWWGGSAAPGRPVASGLALLAIPIAWQYARAAGSPVTQATYRLLVLIGVALAGALVFAQEGLLIANDRDGSSRLLEWLSPNWRLWALFPSFIFHLPWTAAVYVVLWLAIASATLTGLRWLERRKPNRSAGGAGLAALLASLLVIALASVAIPVLLGPTLQPDVRLDARSRVRVLDRYDAQRRPTAIVYDPFRRVPAPTIPWLARLVASPNHRAPRQPVALLFNRRFSLPAGEYEVDLHGAPGTTAEGVLALQLGRVGPPAREWPVRFEAQGAWSARFVLPIDVGFVGFRASSPLDRDIRTLRVRPIHVVDAHARLRSPQVLGTAHYGDTTVFIHDEKIWPEPGGFWTAGGATATVTLARREEPPAATGATGTQEYLRLRVHCGPVANVVTFSTGEWSERLPIAPGEVRESLVPARAGGPTLLRITTQSGFTPAELEPDNLDERVLGAWIEIVGGY